MSKLYFKVGSDWEEVVRLRNEIEKLKSTLKGMDNTQSPAAFKTLNTQLAASTQRMDELVTNAAKAGAVMEGDFKKKIFTASQSVNGFTEKIIAQKAVVKNVEADVKRLGDAYRSALKNNPFSANNKLSEYASVKKALDEEKASLFGLTQEQANARLSVKKLRDEYALYQNDGKQVVETNNGIAISWKKTLGIIGGAATLKALGSEIIRVRGEFQSMQTAMETMVGKEVAGPLIAQVKELAKISPLTMTDMVGAEKMMLGFNIQAEDTVKYLKALSDISMGESGKFNSLTLAFSQMSAAGKLMGQDLNQMINAGFNPLQQISEKTGKSIATLKDEMSKGAISAEMVQQAFLDAASAGGKFYNMSESASKTINGQISMMHDALDEVFNELGTKGEGVIMSGIQATTSLIQNYETVGKVLAGMVATYGVYRTAVMLVTAAESKHTLVEIGLTNVRIVARKAQLALNASMLTNPYVALAVAVAGLVTAMWALSDGTSAAEKAQKRFNDEQDKMTQRENERKSQVESLIRVIQDETETELAKITAYERLQKLSPAITSAYSLEKLAILDLADAQKILNKERDTATYDTYLRNIEESSRRLKQLKRDNGKSLGISPSTGIPLTINNDKAIEEESKYLQQQKKALDEFSNKIMRTSEPSEKSTTYQEDLAKAKEDWLSAKKGYEALLKDQKATSAEVKEAKNSLASKEKTYKDLGGDVGEEKNATKQESAINIQNEKIAELERKQMLDRQRQQEDLEVQLAQSRIDTMESGYEKEQAQRELNNKKEIQTLQRQKEDYIHAYTQMQKEIFDAQEDLKVKQDSKYKKKTFDSSSVTVDTSMFDTIIDNTNQKQTQEQSEYYKELLSRYQSYTEKRLAIQEKFQKDREGLVKAGASKDALGEHDYQREEALKSIDNEFAMREDSFKAWADSITDLSLEKLRELLTQAEQELQSSETLNPDNPQLAVQRAKVSSLKNTVSEKSERAKTSPDKRSLKEWQDLRKTLSEVGKEFDEIGKAVGGTAGEILSAAGSIATSTLQMIDGIMLLADSSAWSMTATATAAQKAIKMVENASVILAIIGAALQIATKIANMFGADYSEYNKAKENYEDYVKVLDTVISKQKELIDTMTGKAAVEASMKALELIEKQADAARILGKERLNAGASAGSHSIGVRINKGMSSEGWNEAKAALGSDFFSKRIDDGRMTGLFDLSVEQLEKLQMEAPTFWAKLDGDVRDYLEQIIACNEKTGEMKDLLNESLTGISFDSLFDNFLESLYDMESSAEDISDDMADYLRKSLIKSFAVENYKGQMKEWYEKWADAMKDGEITSEEQKSLDDLKNSIITGATESAKLINDQFEYLKNDTSQSSSRGGFQTMDQDTGEELNGRFTALQMAGEEIKVQNVSQSESLNILTVKADAILSVNTETRNIADEIRTIQVNSYLELQEIRENTGDTVKQLKAMDEKLKNIENNTKNM
jgi:tape measure domain-containing protein